MVIQQYVTSKSVHIALKCWQKPSGTAESLLSSLLLVQEQQTAVFPTTASPSLRHATNELLLKAINTLGDQSPHKASILHTRFIEGVNADKVAERLDYTTDTIYRQQREAIEALTTLINQWEGKRRAAKAIELEADLQPATYSQLFGTTQQQEELTKRLLNGDGDWVIGVVGIGGLGKTAVTDSAVRHALRQFHFSRALWVRMEPDAANGRFQSPERAYDNLLTQLSKKLWSQDETSLPRQEQLRRIRHQFAQHPYLIIVDNLEDPDDTAYIAEQMGDMTTPSKLLITSRARPQTAVGFYLLTIDELKEADAAALMRHHAHEKGIQFVATATEGDLHTIYQTIGGNPYAIKLVVDLLDLWPLADLIRELVRGSNGSPQELYNHIYRQTWRSLSDNAKLLLQAMPLVADMGGSSTQLQAITNLQEEFWTAVSELRHRSLIEVRGTLQERRYGIHRLTQTFLATEINDWGNDNKE